MLNKPWPRRLARPPDSPAKSSRNAAKAAAGFCHKFGPAIRVAFPVLTTSGMGWPLGVALPPRFQLVGQRWPLITLNGSPEVWRYKPLISQPPTIASSALFMLAPNRLP